MNESRTAIRFVAALIALGAATFCIGAQLVLADNYTTTANALMAAKRVTAPLAQNAASAPARLPS